MQGDSTSDQYGCLICSRHRSYIDPCCTSAIGPTWECRRSVAYWFRTEVKSRYRADVEMQGDSTSDQYGCLLFSRHRSYIEPCCTSDIGPTWECRRSVAYWYRTDLGPMWKCKATRHRTSMVVWYAADIGHTSSRVTHPILGQHENAGEVSPTDIGPR